MRSGNFSSFFYAAKTGNIAELTSLFSEVNGEDKFLNRALQIAVEAGQADTVTYLLAHGADYQARDKYKRNRSLLHNAASKGYAAVILALLDYAHTQDDDGYINITDEDGNTALYDAIVGGYAEAVACLLAQGANTQTRNKFNQVPFLHIAAYNGHTSVIMALQAHAQRQGNNEYLYTRDPKGKTVLHSAASGGHVATVEYLLAQGMDYRDQEQSEGKTPLHEAATDGHIPVMRALLAYAKSQHDEHYLDARDGLGATALHAAALHSESDTVAYLLAQGADYRAQDTSGRIPLYFAAIKGATSSLVALLTQAKNYHDSEYLHTIYRTGETALHAAAQRGHRDAVKYLLAQGADEQCLNNKGETPLHLAVKEGHVPVVRLFCAHTPTLAKTYFHTAFEALLKRLERRPIINPLDLAESNLADHAIARLIEILKQPERKSFHCPNILSFEANSQLSHKSGAYLANLFKKPYPLRGLDLSHTRLSCARTGLTSVLAESKGLQTLKLRDCALDDTDADLLLQGLARKDCALRQLDLSDNPGISANQGALFIAAIAGNQELVLEAIDLQGTGISDQEQAAIKTLVETRLEDWHARVAKFEQAEAAAKLAAASSRKLANQPTEDAFARLATQYHFSLSPRAKPAASAEASEAEASETAISAVTAIP